LGIGVPDEAHHKLLQNSVVSSLTAKGGVAIEQVGDTHLEISSSGVEWTSGPAAPGGVHHIDVGASGLTLRNSTDLVNTVFLSNGNVVFNNDAEVQGTLQVGGDITGSTLHGTLIRVKDTQGVVVTNSTGVICAQTQENGNLLIPQDLSVDNVTASSVIVNGSDVMDLLDQREPAFSVTAPLLKTVSTGGISLGINTGSTVRAAAFAASNFRILEDSADFLKFQIMDTGTGGTGIAPDRSCRPPLPGGDIWGPMCAYIWIEKHRCRPTVLDFKKPVKLKPQWICLSIGWCFKTHV